MTTNDEAETWRDYLSYLNNRKILSPKGKDLRINSNFVMFGDS